MWNNKEFQHLCIAYSTLLLLSLLLLFFFHPIAIFLFFALFSFLLFYAFTKSRYHAIKELSSYLQRVYQGVDSIRIQEYCDGELSILKSDLYKLIHILRQQADELRKDKNFLADSLSDISHQIKTPLTSIMVMSDLLQEDLSQEKRREFVKQMQEQMNRLQWLVSSLLKLSKLDANTIVFHMSKTSLHDVLKKAMTPFLILMDLKQQDCKLTCDESIYVMADENWITEAFCNIIKNSIEHTSQGSSIEIRVEETPLHIHIYISDSGAGIDREDLPHVFERFYRGKNATSDSVGIGLSLSRSIYIQHHASVEVNSEKGVGTTFKVTFYK